MAKPKLSLEVSDKDKRLLLILLSVLVIVAAYMLGYQRFSEKADDYKKELRTLKNEEADLEEKEANLEKYEEGKEEYAGQALAILKRYGSAVTQPSTIEFLNKVERITDAWLKNVSFTGTTEVYKFGQIQTGNPDKQGEQAYSTDLTGYKTALTISYEAEYEQWKELIEYINTYESKNVIESISMSYSNINDTVSGTMTLGLYSIVGGGVVVTEPEFSIGTGSENIFYSDGVLQTTEGDEGDYILDNYDYYILIGPKTAAAPSCIIGARGAEEKDVELTGEGSGMQSVSIAVTGSDGSYSAEYEIDGEKKSASVKTGDTLDLLIVSSKRQSYDDETGIELDISNTSDRPLNVKVFSDDTDNPRVNIRTTEGDVVVH